MELHPILEGDTVPNPGLWYVLSGLGECPSIRVGHTCSYIAGKTDTDNGKLYVVGGANPSGPFCDTYVLDLNSLHWDFIDSPGFRARYEHSAFVPESFPNKVFVFGGADQTGNMNDIQVLDTDTNTWSSVTVSGNPPSERTFHTSACVGDRFIVYSGGHCGPDPVGDRQVHCFNAKTSSWSTLNIKGDSPKPRHGHVMVAVGNRVFVHGGMAGPNFYNDLHILNLERNSWSDVKKKKVFPSARAAHSAVAIDTSVYVFGGMNRESALDDLYKLDTTSLLWTKIEIQGPPPACRLDFAMFVINLWRAPVAEGSTSDVVSATRQAQDVLEKEMAKPGSASSRSSCPEFSGPDSGDQSGEGAAAEQREVTEDTVDGATAGPVTMTAANQQTYRLCVIHGGMDTVGEIFDDMLAINLALE